MCAISKPTRPPTHGDGSRTLLPDLGVLKILCGVAIVWSLFAGPLSPIFSLAIYGGSALLLVIDFNYLRKHGTEDDAVWLATGIFVSIVNIFMSLLNLFGD